MWVVRLRGRGACSRTIMEGKCYNVEQVNRHLFADKKPSYSQQENKLPSKWMEQGRTFYIRVAHRTDAAECSWITQILWSTLTAAFLYIKTNIYTELQSRILHSSDSSLVPLWLLCYLGEPNRSNHSDCPNAHRNREKSEHTNGCWEYANLNYSAGRSTLTYAHSGR